MPSNAEQKNPKEPSIIDEALAAVFGARRDAYGTVNESFHRIALMWTAYLGVPITPQDVAMMMLQLKVARARQGILSDSRPQWDSLVDIVGYALCSETLLLLASTPATENEK